MRKLIILLLVLSLLAVPVSAEKGPVEIRTAADLAAIAEDPSGSYILMNDLDMSGVEWKSVDFSGSFDGNGKAILNLTIAESGDKMHDSYDGNSIFYPTVYFGLFGLLENAEVKNLSLVNVRSVITCDEPCYLGGIAGGMQDSAISGCTVIGTLELRAHNSAFGVGGIAGFGTGTMDNCSADVTLICTDTDAATKDEQFMGGLYANGFILANNNTAKIDGYISEHGYVHSGGMIGMFMRVPNSGFDVVDVSGNKAEGMITFFEDNDNRRAYCKGDVGEVLGYNYRMQGNVAPTFVRNEKSQWNWDFSVEVRPEMCENARYTEVIVPGTCTDFGYAEFTCTTCGYSYRDHYTLPAHVLTAWEVQEEATAEHEGLETAVCNLCGETAARAIPKLEPEETVPMTEETEPEVIVTTPAEIPTIANSTHPEYLYIALGCAALAVVSIAGTIFFGASPKGGARPKRRKNDGMDYAPIEPTDE